MDEAVDRAATVIADRYDDPAKRSQIAEAVGIGALKYGDLSVARDSGYVLDFDRLLALTGNTGPYLQYAAARIRSIFARAGLDPADATGPIRLGTGAERVLGAALARAGPGALTTWPRPLSRTSWRASCSSWPARSPRSTSSVRCSTAEGDDPAEQAGAQRAQPARPGHWPRAARHPGARPHVASCRSRPVKCFTGGSREHPGHERPVYTYSAVRLALMENRQLGSAGQAGQSAPAPRPGRAKRVVTTIAASAILLGSGAAIGVALTGGASAATASAAGRRRGTRRRPLRQGGARSCAAMPDVASSHPAVVKRLRAFCGNPLLRLAAVGGEYGQVTFKGKTSPKTVAFERGTIESVTGSAFTVRARTARRGPGTSSPAPRCGKPAIRRPQVKLSSGDLVLVIGLVSRRRQRCPADPGPPGQLAAHRSTGTRAGTAAVRSPPCPDAAASPGR